MDTIGGLVAHPLLVHIPVVLLPLSLVGLVLLAVRPGWQRTGSPIVACLVAVGFVGAVLASSSGESLEERFESTGQTLTASIRDHGEMGESVPLIAGLFLVLVVAWTAFGIWRRRAGDAAAVARVRKPSAVAAGLLALSLVAGAATAVAVVRTGHSGAESVWQDA